MDVKLERERLSQSQTLQELLRPIGPAELVTVYSTTYPDGGHSAFYCALIPHDRIDDALSSTGWDLKHGQGLPCSNGSYRFPETLQYLRFGNSDGIEPLVVDRSFSGSRDDYLEISEEFRLFHNLYHDRQRDEYIKMDEGGNEIVVAVVEPKLVKIRMKELRQFLAIKEMYLSIQVDCAVYSRYRLEELGITADGRDLKQDLACWNLSISSTDIIGGPGRRTLSSLQGKRLIAPLPKANSGFGDFAEPGGCQYVDYIIRMDDHGNDVVHTCDPDALANFFGRNRGAAHEVTPVSFRRQVLDKYYQEPSKFKIEDGYLSCASLWDLRIDNHHDDKVCVLLRDLAYLPFSEQLHWRSYNFASASGYSEVAVRRNFLAEWVESDQPEHAFQEKYLELTRVCQENLGWQFLLPLKGADAYHLQSIRVPSTNEQRDFDGLALGLATILVDSINVQGLKSLIPQYEYDGKSISLLSAVLEAYDVGEIDDHIDFIRNLQGLRSSGAAHRKGSRYVDIAQRFGIGDHDLRTVFAEILWKAVAFLDRLIELVQSLRVRESVGDLPPA